MSLDCLSESATKDLVNLLLKRGYFHVDGVLQLADEARRSNAFPVYAETDVACQLVTTQDGNYMTKDTLRVHLLEEISAFGGRMSVENAAIALAVDPIIIEQVSESSVTVIRVGDDLIIDKYFDQMAEKTDLQLVKNDGSVLVSELASSTWDMPMDLTLSALKKRIDSGMIVARILMLSGAKVLATPAFEERERCRIRGAFRTITLPTQVRYGISKLDTFHPYNADPSFIF